jgi:serine/threonine-protein kinase
MTARAPADGDDSGDFPRVREIFESALDQPAQERTAFVTAACGSDGVLLAAVQEMLRADAEPHPLLDSGAGVADERWRPGDTFAGHYRIVALLGRGGMGEVYRAHDATLGRDVALKLLPSIPGAAEGTERLNRFQREAQVLAALNHPNIGAIHGVDEADGVRALVLELVEGPTLADRIAAGPLPLGEALSVARQIATGLEAAHEQGIVHRDLKPANVKLRPDGTVKLLDFGLAKMMQPELVPGGTPHSSPIITTPSLVQRGVLLGTAAYASPEQAKGREADKRSDVWAFGALLYEMLSGERVFKGADIPETIAAVLRADLDLSRLPPATPAPLRHLLARCLERDVTRRLRDVGEARIVLDDLAAGRSATAATESTAVAARWPWRRVLPPAAAALAGGAAVAALLWRPAPQPPPVTRFTLSMPADAALLLDPQSRDLTISPDGTRIVYKGGPGADRSRLFVYALDQLEPKPLTSSGQPKGPFISPDGQWVGFFEPGGIAGGVGASFKRVAIAGGPPLPASRLDGPSRGATWGDHEIIAASGTPATGLLRIPAAGGEPVVLTRPDRNNGERDHLWPHLLPGGKTVLFTVTSLNGGMDTARVAALDLASGRWTTLLQGASQAQYVPTGHLVYVAGGALWAVSFDAGRVEITGTPAVVVSGVVVLRTGTAEFDVARDGTLVYVARGGAHDRPRTLVWVDRDGRETPIAAPPRAYAYVRLSPDNTRVAVEIEDQAQDVWVWDLARDTLTQVTTDAGQDETPVWTRDGQRIIFTSQTGANLGSLFWRAADGTGVAEPLLPSETIQRASDVLPDGTRLLFSDPAGLMSLSLDGKRSVVPLIPAGSGPIGHGVASPDGRWLAYVTLVAGTPQIFVSALSNPGGARSQLTPSGGSQPRWSADGRELFYAALDGALVSVPVQSGPTFAWGTPTQLFPNSFYVGRGVLSRGGTYDVTSDGRRFLMLKTVGDSDQLAEAATVVVVKNWGEELKRLVPPKR